MNLDPLLLELQPLWDGLEAHCVAACCGLEAFDFDLALTPAQCAAVRRTRAAVEAVEGDTVTSQRLNVTCPKAEILALLDRLASDSVRIALANVPFPKSREWAVERVEQTLAEAGDAAVVCFPEAYIPGYRCFRGHQYRVSRPPDAAFLEAAWTRIAAAAARHNTAVVLGTERWEEERLYISSLVIDADGRRLGFQDKVQLDPSEDETYTPGTARHVFTVGRLTFGISICHEGWRYPETVRWAARRGAQVVFHPHLHVAEHHSYQPSTFGHPANSFHEKAMLCRAAENTCYFASVNCASAGSPTTSAVAAPDGTLLAWQPYGQEGLLVADLNLARATGLLAQRWKPSE